MVRTRAMMNVKKLPTPNVSFGRMYPREKSVSVCANEEIAELETLKNKEVKYFEKPDSLKCGKMKKVSGNMDATACKDLENAEAGDIYFKTDLTDVAKCEIALTPKTLG